MGTAAAVLVQLHACAAGAGTAALPAGFVEQTVADSIDSPTAMAMAPDGRLFVCEQGGRVRVVRHGRLLARPFVVVPAAAVVEQGLVGITCAARGGRTELYLVYTAPAPGRHERVVRYDATGDTARAGDGRVLLELDDDVGSRHVGGALAVGRDGMLYVGTGDNDDPPRSQSLGSTSGKVLRVGRDGRIPGDNPFVSLTTDARRAIWARGFRNVFAMAFEPRTGRLFAIDVGGDRWEEVNVVARGANYGWPMFEGPGSFEALRFPVAGYDHQHGCAIVGAAFYTPAVPSFGRAWMGRFVFADFCTGEIRWLDPRAPRAIHTFAATRVPGPVAVAVGRSGDLYYLARGSINPVGGEHSSLGALVRIRRVGPSR
jgi:glucose/arabinose dehydrogenase